MWIRQNYADPTGYAALLALTGVNMKYFIQKMFFQELKILWKYNADLPAICEAEVTQGSDNVSSSHILLFVLQETTN